MTNYNNQVFLQTDLHNASTTIGGRGYKAISLPALWSTPYSQQGRKSRAQILDTLKYVQHVEGDPTGLQEYFLKWKREGKVEDLFSPWLRKDMLQKDLDKVGRVAWLSILAEQMKMPAYPSKFKNRLKLNDQPPFAINFEDALALMRLRVGNPLNLSVYMADRPYNPAHQDHNSSTFQNRKDTIKEIGEVVHYMGRNHGNWLSFWHQGILYARTVDPTAKKLKTNPKFFGGLFPIGYKDNPTGHPRLLYTNGNNVSTIKGSWRVASLILWEKHTNLHTYAIDLASAHVRSFYWACTGKYAFSTNNQVLLDGNYWDRLAEDFLTTLPSRDILPFKTIRKTFKIGSLAIMNGGAVNSKKNLESCLTNKYDKKGNQMLDYIDMLVTYLTHLETTREIKLASSALANKGVAWPLGSSSKYINTTEPHKVLSAIYSGPEVLALTHMVQTALLPGINLIPLALEFDGMVVASKYQLCDSEIANLECIFSTVLHTILGVEYPVTIKKLTSQ